MARILITSALPYINGIKHLGNLVGSQLPADLYARYMRGRGHEVMFICATDEHGTPAELAAAKTGEAVADYCARMHDVQAELARGFRLSFDHYGRSSSPQNHALTQHLAAKLGGEAGLIEEVTEKQVLFSSPTRVFLPDRYIEGTCPNCGYDRARGDQCENCTKQLDPTDLVNPRSAISGATDLEVRETKTPVSCANPRCATGWTSGSTANEGWPIPDDLYCQRNGACMTAMACRTGGITRDLDWGRAPAQFDGAPWQGQWMAKCSMSG